MDIFRLRALDGEIWKKERKLIEIFASGDPFPNDYVMFEGSLRDRPQITYPLGGGVGELGASSRVFARCRLCHVGYVSRVRWGSG